MQHAEVLWLISQSKGSTELENIEKFWSFFFYGFHFLETYLSWFSLLWVVALYVFCNYGLLDPRAFPFIVSQVAFLLFLIVFIKLLYWFSSILLRECYSVLTCVQPEFVMLINYTLNVFCQGLLFIYNHYLVFKIIRELLTLFLHLTYPYLFFRCYFLELLIIHNEWFASNT